jgi:hypothetical protein
MARSWSFKVVGSADKLFALTVRAIADLGYRVSHSDAGGRTVSFEKPASWKKMYSQSMSASVTQNGDAAELVIGGGQAAQALVAVGEKERIARRIYEKVLELAPKTSDAPYQETAATDRTASTADELERLARLHGDGSLTDDEFAAAKAKLLA